MSFSIAVAGDIRQGRTSPTCPQPRLQCHQANAAPEGIFDHKVIVPFSLQGKYTVDDIKPEGEYKVGDTIATLKDENAVLRGELDDLEARVAALEQAGAPAAQSFIGWWLLAGLGVAGGVALRGRRPTEIEQ